jgi:uncharacterized protein YcbK (DUF882 family)
MPIPLEEGLVLKHFDLSEFDSPDEPGSGNIYMDKKFLEKLDYARGNVEGKMIFKITSGYRSEKWNLKVGGKWGSSHKVGKAADIAYNGSRECYWLLTSLLSVGINRLGVGKGFVHCDVDNLKKEGEVIWLY